MTATEFSLRFYGVRGSVATGGLDTARFGGNTSCTLVEVGDHRVVLDGGTGMRALGQDLMKKLPVQATVLFSHMHWDHIQGLPFFVPAYVPGNIVAIYAEKKGDFGPSHLLGSQMTYPVFPVKPAEMKAQLSFHELEPGSAREIAPGLVLKTHRLNHPDDSLGFRLEAAGHTLLYITDIEHDDARTPALAAFCQGADVLIYDAMYTPEEYPRYRGWGHSTWDAAVELAQLARVSKLILFHHEPTHNDDFVLSIEAEARQRFANVACAYEGMEIDVCTGRIGTTLPQR